MTLLKYMVIALCAGFLAGCSSGGGIVATQEMLDLEEVKRLLHTAASKIGHPPARLADLEGFQKKWPEAYNSLKSGDYVVLWGTPINWGTPISKSKGDVGKPEMVLAYEKAAPTDGGYVLTSAGNVTKMSAAEFASATKTKK
jgi:hypothetical protein